eukprot:1949321-Alexandrium_andersonii.AAC.1
MSAALHLAPSAVCEQVREQESASAQARKQSMEAHQRTSVSSTKDVHKCGSANAFSHPSEQAIA